MITRIGILGGTFNPIHNGHIRIAKVAMEKSKLGRVIFLPTGNPPHKKNEVLLEENHRYEMVKNAIEDYENFYVSNIELDRKDYVYTFETLKMLRKHENRPHNLFYIIGSDVLFDLENWKNINKVVELCEFIVFKRPGFIDGFEDRIEYMRRRYGNIFNYLEIEVMNISSSNIRENINKTETMEKVLPKKVYEYIKKNGLYNYGN